MGAIYYPSCLVNLRLRFDENYRIVELPTPASQEGDAEAATLPEQPPPTDANRRKRRAPRVSIGVAFKETGPGDYKPNTRPLITQSSREKSTNNLSVIANRIPKSAMIEMPTYRQAGRFSLEFDWRELPIDPRLVRACGVEIFIGTVSPENFGRGMLGTDIDGQRLSILRNLPDEAMALAGIADSWATSHSDGGSIIRIDGRDLRGLFLDSPINPEVLAKIDLAQPVNKVVRALIDTHPAAPLMQVIAHPQDWPNEVIPDCADKDGLTRVRRGAGGDQASGAGGNDDFSFWDAITSYTQLVGAVAFFRGRDLVIRPIRSIFDQSKPWFDPNDETFRPRQRLDDDGRPFTERKMVFGRNIKELNFERKLSGVKVPVVEVASLDTSSAARGNRKLLVEQWPPKDKELARIAGVSPSGEMAQEDKLRIYKNGIRDRAKLLGIARSIWEEVGRGELGGSCTTTMLASFKGDNSDPDICRLRPGDPVDFVVDTRELSGKIPNVSTYTDSHRLPFDTEVEQVKQRLAANNGGGDENIARVIVASARSMVFDLITTFRTANVVFNWSLDGGLQASFDFQSYFTPRYDINEQLGKNVVPVESETSYSNLATRPKAVIRSAPTVKSTPKATIGKATAEPWE